MLALDQIQTVALAGLVLFVGYGVRRLLPFLAAYNIPAPVVGGLLMAGFVTIARAYNWTPLTFTTTLQAPLMIAFFTTIGFGASLSLLRVGGPAVLLFFTLSTLMAVVQNVIGVGAAYALGQHPLMGVLAGSVTLTGGPATGLAFAPLFEQAGIGADAAHWLAEKDIVAVGCDNAAVEVIPFDDNDFLNIHKILLVNCGIYLLEFLNLVEPANDGVYEGMLSVGPLKVTGATGSPINPIFIG
jgi:sodium--glutamate symport carrier gltS